jgi:tRNA U38,U39,U40 pseudouridine synthase TruA
MTAERGDAPFDLDAARAARREAAGEGFKFKWGKKNYECPPAKEWPITVTATFSEGKLTEALEQILGEKQFAAFMKQQPSVGDIEALMGALAKFSGIGDDAGNS